ncbi:MAG: hypothetical protein MRY72_00370 [Aquisalinus sp.]|nr:hypothetical protein [Aquisalinus sp.]
MIITLTHPNTPLPATRAKHTHLVTVSRQLQGEGRENFSQNVADNALTAVAHESAFMHHHAPER